MPMPMLVVPAFLGKPNENPIGSSSIKEAHACVNATPLIPLAGAQKKPPDEMIR